MVLVIAALYHMYQARRQASENISENSVNDSTSQPEEFTESLRRSGSALYQNAILRCSPRGSGEMEEPSSAAAVPFPVSTSPPDSAAPPENIFLNSCKNEWIDAVFGSDFLRPHCPLTGKGVAGEFQTLTVSIPATGGDAFSDSNNKVGVTVSRLAIGCYVRAVTGEAAVAGIQRNSILIAINDLPVLAEPTKQLLERLWQYEGYFNSCSESEEDNEILMQDSNMTESATNNSNGVIREPVTLKFVHNGQVYTTVMLSNPPWGIQWAPVANFPLVKRVYSFAATAGVKRGSLVVAVNGRTVRDMDHVATATHIRDLFENRQAIRLTLAFAPVTARTGHYERLLTGQRSIDPPQHQKVPHSCQPQLYDGVEIKFLPLGYAIGSLCNSDKNVFYEDTSTEVNVDEIAEQVAAGRIEAPILSSRRILDSSRRSRQQGIPPKYLACPSLRADQMLEQWDPLESLVYCLRFQRCSFDVDSFVDHLSNFGDSNSRIEMLHELVSGPRGADLASAFLLQFISLICAPGQCVPTNDGKRGEENDLEKQSDVTKKNANELTSMLLKLSRKNEAFCQRLYFLLRSYISTFETSRPASGSDGDSQNLMALLNCLELLRFAEKELAGRQPVKKATSSKHSDRLNKYNDLGSIRGIIEPSPVPSPIPASPESPPSSNVASGSPKKKGLVGFLRKKNSKSPPRPQRHIASQRTAPPESARIVAKEKEASQLEHSQIDPCSLSLVQSPSTMYENMSDFLTELDKICAKIESSLQKSFRQKIADWAMQPWSAGKDAALTEVTEDMRKSLEEADSQEMLLVNPVESSELLSSVDYDECYILPSAHFPILLTFNVSERRCSDSIVGEEKLYRTKVELISLRGSSPSDQHSFTVQGAVAGTLCESGESSSLSTSSTHHTWKQNKSLIFETRSSWGAPQTLSLLLSGNSDIFDKRGNFNSEVGFCWLDLSELWKDGELFDQPSKRRITTDVWPIDSADTKFDDHGDLPDSAVKNIGKIQLDLKITTECVEFDDDDSGSGPKHSRKRMLLYKHGDDLRQEAFAVQFIRTCDDILKASGLDMKLLTFQCIPVGTRRGFVEWIPGSVPLSEICHPFAGTVLENRTPSEGRISPPMLTKAGLSKYESLRRLGGLQTESLRRIASGGSVGSRGSIANDPVQNYLRSVAFDPEAPYLIRRDVMDTYVKSCAGYSVITYILGVGDRHLDNLLLHQSGSFFHCDYSFLLGSDPKKYLSMRITEDMVYGMGGKDSDNYAKFLSLTGAAFLALRRPENVRVLLSMVRLMKASCLPDISENQTIEQAILGVRYRLRLDLSESRAISFMEELVEASLSNKMWIAVDAMHHLGKKF